MKILLKIAPLAGSFCLGAMLVLGGCKSNPESNRVVEAKFLARLDINRQPLEMDSAEWGSALYFAVKPTARDHYADDLNSSTYQIADGQTTILAGAFETEPYSGRIIIKHADGAARLLAHISKGRLVRTATITDADGQRRTAIDYNDRGTAKRTQEWDSNGTLIASVDHQAGTTTSEPGPNTPPTNRNLPAEYLEFGKVEIRGWRVFEKTETHFAYQGFLVEFHDKAKQQLARVEYFVEGQPDGKVIWWHPNGQIHYEADYVNGEPEGLATWWRSDGTKEYEADWQNGKLNRATTWDAAGTENGKKVLNGNGTLIFLHADGSKRQEAVYADGVLSDEHWWDEEGNELPKAPILFRLARPRLAP